MTNPHHPTPDASPAIAAVEQDATPRPPRQRTRRPGGICGNCGFEDSGHYCSRCGEPLHGTEDTVLEILWSDLVEGPLHNLFALGKTTWLMLLHPQRFFDGVLRRQRGLSSFPFFLAPAWRRVSHKPHGVPNAVKYFVLLYTLTFVAAWLAGVDVAPQIRIPLRQGDAVLPGAFAEPLVLAFVVAAAWMYAAAVSRLLGGRIETEMLTKFMLYLNGFALIPFVGMGVAGLHHPWIFFPCLAAWLYALFALPQVALPGMFGISRVRLGLAQAGAAVANGVLVVAMIFCAGILADLLMPGWTTRGRNAPRAASMVPFDPRQSGLSAVRRASEATVFPMDTLGALMRIPLLPPDTPAPRPTRRGLRQRAPR
jgi:hypothetical protein